MERSQHQSWARASASWRVRNRDRYLASQRRYRATKRGQLVTRRNRLKQYGLTPEQFDEMLTAQGGVCAVCRNPETRAQKGKTMPLVVDHNHHTGAIRGLLCHACNSSIGQLKEDPDVMRAMANYIDVDRRRSED